MEKQQHTWSTRYWEVQLNQNNYRYLFSSVNNAFSNLLCKIRIKESVRLYTYGVYLTFVYISLKNLLILHGDDLEQMFIRLVNGSWSAEKN